MNFFEQELRKLTANNFTLSDTKFIGKVCYIPLTENTRMKLEFVTHNIKDRYEGIRATVFDKSDGKIDTLTVSFADVWGTKKVNNSNFKQGLVPHAWINSGKAEWYVYKPNITDYEVFSEQFESYTELFMDQEQTQSMGMSQQM